MWLNLGAIPRAVYNIPGEVLVRHSKVGHWSWVNVPCLLQKLSASFC